MANTSSIAKKFSMAKTQKGLKNILALVAGLFLGGLLEQYAMSKIAFLADTKTDATDPTKTSKNTIGVLLKSAIYVVGGLVPSQLSDNELLKYAGYGISAYGGAQLAKGLSASAKVYGLGGLSPHFDPPPQVFNYLNEAPTSM